MKSRCPDCRAEFEVDEHPVACPRCGRLLDDVLSLDELSDLPESEAKDRSRSRKKTCPMCGAENRPGAGKCRGCGEAFAVRRPPAEKKEIWLGVASCGVVALSAATILGVFVATGVLVVQNHDNGQEPSQVTFMMIGFGFIGGAMLNVVGIIIGIVALCFPNQNKIYAVLGTVIGATIFLGVAGLFMLGLAVQGV